MALIDELRPGQGIGWTVKSRVGAMRGAYLVIGKSNTSVVVVPVFALDEYTKCYDDPGAQYERDRDNVRLDHSPWMFTEHRDDVTGKCYVYANMSQPIPVSRAFLELNHVEVLDGGRTIDDWDMKVVKNHPWPHNLQREKTSDFSSAGSNRGKKDDDFAAGDDEDLILVNQLKPNGGGISAQDDTALGLKACGESRRKAEKDAVMFTAQGSGWVQKELAKPGSSNVDGKIGQDKTGPKGLGE